MPTKTQAQEKEDAGTKTRRTPKTKLPHRCSHRASWKANP
jgi:hypothetical protein